MSKYDEAVNEALKGATTDDKGKVAYPEGTSEEVQYMANLEKRRRDTQTSLQDEKKITKQLTSENTKMADAWGSEVSKTLTPEQQTELEELKHTDPELWREKLNEHEETNKDKFKEKRESIKKEATEETELEQRTRLLTEHNEANPDYQLTDEVIANDLPPRISNKLKNGDVSFEEFLSEANAFLGTPKVVGDAGEKPPADIDLDDAGGSETPPASAVDANIAESYKNETY